MESDPRVVPRYNWSLHERQVLRPDIPVGMEMISVAIERFSKRGRHTKLLHLLKRFLRNDNQPLTSRELVAMGLSWSQIQAANQDLRVTGVPITIRASDEGPDRWEGRSFRLFSVAPPQEAHQQELIYSKARVEGHVVHSYPSGVAKVEELFLVLPRNLFHLLEQELAHRLGLPQKDGVVYEIQYGGIPTFVEFANESVAFGRRIRCL